MPSPFLAQLRDELNIVLGPNVLTPSAPVVEPVTPVIYTEDGLYAAALAHGADQAASRAFAEDYTSLAASGKILPDAAKNAALTSAFNAALRVITTDITGGDTTGPVVKVTYRLAAEAEKAFVLPA